MSFTDELRARLMEKLACSSCGSIKGGWNAAAARTGMDQATLWRWLAAGRKPRSTTIDQAIAFLARSGGVPSGLEIPAKPDSPSTLAEDPPSPPPAIGGRERGAEPSAASAVIFARLSRADAIERVMEELGGPVKYRNLARELQRRGHCASKPFESFSNSVWMAMTDRHDRFRKTGPGTFELITNRKRSDRRNGEPDAPAARAAALEEVMPAESDHRSESERGPGRDVAIGTEHPDHSEPANGVTEGLRRGTGPAGASLHEDAPPAPDLDPSCYAGSRNGAGDRGYHGPAKVRELPPGLSGADLRENKLNHVRVGAIWLRGRQRVRIEKLMGNTVHFVELSFGNAHRRLPRGKFLQTSWPANGPRTDFAHSEPIEA